MLPPPASSSSPLFPPLFFFFFFQQGPCARRCAVGSAPRASEGGRGGTWGSLLAQIGQGSGEQGAGDGRTGERNLTPRSTGKPAPPCCAHFTGTERGCLSHQGGCHLPGLLSSPPAPLSPCGRCPEPQQSPSSRHSCPGGNRGALCSPLRGTHAPVLSLPIYPPFPRRFLGAGSRPLQIFSSGSENGPKSQQFVGKSSRGWAGCSRAKAARQRLPPCTPSAPHFTQKKTLKSLGPPAKPGHKAALKRIQVWREMGGKGFLSGTSSSASKEIIARHERADDAGQMNLGNKAPGASWGDVRSQQQWLPRVRATRSRLSGRGDEAGARQTPAVPPQLLVPRAQPRPRGAQRAPGTLGTGKAAAAKSCGWPERVAESWGASEEVTE